MFTIARRTAVAALAAGAFALAASAAEAQLARVTIGTNPAGSGYHVIGGALAKTIQEKLDLQATARPFSGSSVYLPMLHRGEITFGLNSSNDLLLAYNAVAPYTDRMNNVRLTMAVWPINHVYRARADSGITDVADLKGRRIVVTVRGNAMFARLHRAILASESWAELQSDYTLLRNQDAAEHAPANHVVPYHPGAVKYYKEAGMWTDAHEAQQQKVSD